jgi:hypothetical protein
VARLPAIYELLMLLPGPRSIKARRKAAQIAVRVLGGDRTICEEVESNRAYQERLKALNPEHPDRVFGEEAERNEAAARASAESDGALAAEAREPPPAPYQVVAMGNDPRDLYVGTCPALLNKVKIGISENPEERQLQIQRRWPGFVIRVVYKGGGQLELSFKRHFASRQAKMEKETEWFEITLEEAAEGIRALDERQKEERRLEAQRIDEELEREHKRRRLEAETTKFEAAAVAERQKFEADAAFYCEIRRLSLAKAQAGEMGLGELVNLFK